ncbi:hydrolase [Methanobrevibacter sp. OttesenSCG-928-K11]|nr:hydrolase [Methanobrevibacter sp. OttesenSCG-928-K11]MDL2270779.1 hydrolase [Methanobrevibacter sp. OttesenSCG-928-I08]
MTSEDPIRDPVNDKLLTPENSALIIIDYQPTQINSINSMLHKTLVKNIKSVAKIANLYKVPIILSTVNVSNGQNEDTIPSLKKELKGIPSYDRTSINAWEDVEFYDAVKKTNRKNLIICALWTEACLTFPAIDAINENYEVYTIVDAVGGTSKIAHETALRRIEQAGTKLITINQFICELQRDWNRKETIEGFVKLMFEIESFYSL